MDTNNSIGIFDSGLGGLTVLREVMKALPRENFIYFGDTARVPYGDKSPETIVRYSFENTSFLLSHGIKLLLVACNTASAYALENLRQELSVPVVDVIEPAVRRAVEMTNNRRIAVLGTRATTSSGVYQRKIQEALPGAEVFSIPCPLLVPLVEENFCDHAATRMIVHDYLKPVKEHRVDTVILGCTHYPLLFDLIREEIGDEVSLLDSATACACEVVEQLEKRRLNTILSSEGKRRYYVSDSPERFRDVGEVFLDMPIDKVEIS